MPKSPIGSEKFQMMRLLLGLEVIYINIMIKIDLELVAQSVEDLVKVKNSKMKLPITKIPTFQNLSKIVIISNLNGLKVTRLNLRPLRNKIKVFLSCNHNKSTDLTLTQYNFVKIKSEEFNKTSTKLVLLIHLH